MVVRLTGILIEAAAQIREVLEEQRRERQRQVREATKEKAEGAVEITIGDDHADGEIKREIPDPPLERNQRKVGPGDARQGVNQAQGQWPVVEEKRAKGSRAPR